MKKKPRSLFYILSGLTMLTAIFLAQGFTFPQTIDPIEAGKQIYTKGTSPSGQEIYALMSGVKVPASVLPCVNCHGTDGAGRPEGGVNPSNLQWDILSNDNGGQHHQRRKHPPYTNQYLKRAITMGLDPAGNEMLKTMPKYLLSQEDISYLVAYLKVLGKEKEKGIENTKIKTGFVLPSEATDHSKRKALQKVLEAYFSEINIKGGIYNRKFELQFADPDFMEQSEGILASCFAIGGYWGISENQKIEDWATEKEMPVTGAVAWAPINEGLENKYVFYLFAGLLEQAEAQVKFLAEKGKFDKRNIALIHDATEDSKSLAISLKTTCEKYKAEKVNQLFLKNTEEALEKTILQLKEAKVNTVFYFATPGQENDFFKMAHKQAWYPEFLGLGVRSGIRPSEIPKPFDQRIFLAYPNWLDELSESGWGLYQSLKSKYELSDDFQNLQLSALGAAIIYVETVRNCGRKLTKEKLIAELEKLYDYQTGLMPLMSYGLNNRVGSHKVYMISVDLEQATLKLETIVKK